MEGRGRCVYICMEGGDGESIARCIGKKLGIKCVYVVLSKGLKRHSSD